jgi:hypothetical protein
MYTYIRMAMHGMCATLHVLHSEHSTTQMNRLSPGPVYTQTLSLCADMLQMEWQWGSASTKVQHNVMLLLQRSRAADTGWQQNVTGPLS